MRLFWVLRAAFAAAAGAFVRLSRRVRGLPPRIWRGPWPLHSIPYMVAADRAAGYPSRSCVVSSRQVKTYALVTRSEFDRVIEDDAVPWQDWHWLALIDLLWHGDVWVSFFDGLFFHVSRERRNVLAFRLIRLAGIRIIATAHGSDIVHITRRKTRYDWVGRLQLDYPTWNLADQTPVSLKRIEWFCRFSDLVLPADAIMARLLPRCDVLFKPFPIDCDALQPAPFRESGVVRVVHAPNHRHVKGTEFLIAAVQRVQDRGFGCELVMIERLARAEALKRYADADVIADQFCMGGWAQFALEGMALAKPVLCYLDQEHLSDPVFNLPAVNAVPERLAEVLAALIAVPELRRRLGEASRTAVERYQSVGALAEVWDKLYACVWRGAPLRLDEAAHFSPERTPRAFTEDPLDPSFWPVEVADLMDAIGDAVRRVRGD